MQLPFLKTAPSTNAMSSSVYATFRLVALELLLERVIDCLRMNKCLRFVLIRKQVLAVLFGNLHLHLLLLLFDLLKVFLYEFNLLNLLYPWQNCSNRFFQLAVAHFLFLPLVIDIFLQFFKVFGWCFLEQADFLSTISQVGFKDSHFLALRLFLPPLFLYLTSQQVQLVLVFPSVCFQIFVFEFLIVVLLLHIWFYWIQLIFVCADLCFQVVAFAFLIVVLLLHIRSYPA